MSVRFVQFRTTTRIGTEAEIPLLLKRFPDYSVSSLDLSSMVSGRAMRPPKTCFNIHGWTTAR